MEGETHEQRLAVLAGLHGGDKGGLVERIIDISLIHDNR